MNKQNYKKGFTLLFASLIGALVIAVGLAILSITIKQIALSSAGRATQQAFYTADAATECAVFLNRGANSMNTSVNPQEQNCYEGFFPEPTLDFSTYQRCGSSGTLPQDVADNMICMGRKIVLNPGSIDLTKLSAHQVTSSFDFDASLTQSNDPDPDNDMCFKVTVTKIGDDPNTTIENTPVGYDESATIIQTRGYNTCKNVTNKFERAIRTVNK